MSSGSIGRSSGPQPWDTYSKTDDDNLKVARVSSTDNAIVRFDGTSGLVQNSSVVIDDSGNVGIGTNSPGQKLVVDGGSNTRVRAKTGTSVGNYAKFEISTDGSATSSSYQLAEITSSIVQTSPLKSDLSFSTNQGNNLTTAMTLDSSGNVGIGVTPSAKLHFGDGTDNSTTVKTTEIVVTSNDANWQGSGAGIKASRTWLNTSWLDFMVSNGSTRYSAMRIDSTGNVGIGTSSPSDKFHISGGNAIIDGVTNGNLAIRGASGYGGTLGLFRQTTRDGYITTLNTNNNPIGGTNADIAIIADGGGRSIRFSTTGNSTQATIDSSGNVGIGTSSPSRKLIVAGGSTNAGLEVLSANGYRTALIAGRGSAAPALDQGYFAMTDQGTTKVVLDTAGDSYFNGGNVGIGTSSPNQLLTVYKYDATNTGIATTSSISLYNPQTVSGGIGSAIRFYGDTRGYNNFAGIGGMLSTGTSTGATGSLTFYTKGAESDTLPTERMRIDSSGNVGIGTSSPAQKLHIVNADPRIRMSTGSKTCEVGADSNGGWLQTLESGSDLRFYTGAAVQAMRLDASGNLQFNSGYGSAATAYGCRAWVNFNGTGTVAIRASGNVSSITDNGVGNYMVNITTAMPDTNYSVSGVCSADIDQGGESIRIDTARGTSIYTNSIRLGTSYKAGYFDASYVTISVFR